MEVRCVRLDNTNRFRVAFPENCRIDLASKTVKQFQPLPAASPLKRRRDCELPLEGQLLTYVNTLCVSKKAVFKEGRILEDDNYLIAVVYITPMAIPKAIATKY